VKKNEAKKVIEAKKLKRLRLSRETLQTLTRSDAKKAVGDTGAVSPAWQCEPQSRPNCPGDTGDTG
jgi:hypothetical protein